MQKPLQFSICEMLSEPLRFGSSYAMGILCVLSHPYDLLSCVGSPDRLATFAHKVETDKEGVNKAELLWYT